MKRYEAYKDSGVKWIGEIPSHWEMRRVKYLFFESKEKSIIGNEVALSLSKDLGIIPSMEKTNKTMESASLVGCKLVRKGDIVFNRFKARLFAVSKYDGVVSPDYAVYKCKDSVHAEYIVKLFGTKLFREEFDRKASGIGDGFSRLYTNDLFAFYSIYPPLCEQQAIADYLKEKTSKIEQYIAQREKEVELLGELKQSEIANVVTKGLNPDVPMKDSGIPWIGEIPAHWEVKRIKSFLSESKEKTTDNDGVLLSLSQYTGISLKSEANKVGMFEAETTEGYNVVHKGQFVMNIMLAWNGSYAVSELDGVISPAYCVFNFKQGICKKYFHYLWRTQAYQGAFKTMSKGIIDSRLRLYPMYFLAFKSIIPPLSEQQAIVDYIDTRIAKIDQHIAGLTVEIEYLKEFKQRLISDAVTGQIKVTE